MKHSPQFRSRREEERAAAKNTRGYKIWSVMFTLMYPFIAVFTFVFSCIVMFFSGISRVLAYVLGKGHAEN
jgi:cellulose synthase/poly-beta-1,6-N-acetylglucosamine synthase-like glycosyltransferase